MVLRAVDRMPNRIPPHNLDAEESVLGAMLESRDAVTAVIEILKPEDFYQPAHARIYEVVCDLYNRSQPADAITVADELGRRGFLDEIGGKPYIHGLLEAYPTASSAAHYARIVDEHAILRRLVEAGNKVQELGFSIPEDVGEAVDEAEQTIYEVGDRRLRSDLQQIKPLLAQTMVDLESIMNGSGTLGLSSGFGDLDDMTLGFQPSQLVIVAARPSMGKSSLLGDFALNAAVRHHQPVIMFSLEMSAAELTQRFLASEARVDSQKMRRGSLSEQDWTKMSAALGRLAEAPLYIDDSANITLMEMRAKCRRIKARQGLGLVIVDYLQLMQGPRKSENRQQEVSELSRGLKILAKELEVPVMCASQLNRAVEARHDKHPFLGDLRESGCLTGDTRVSLADGRVVAISDLVGARPVVATLNGWTMDQGHAVEVWKTGHRPVHRLRTRTGREIRVTDNHRFLVFEGWKALGDLKVGERIAEPRGISAGSSTTRWDEDRVVLLAHLIGDGCYASRQPLHYTTASEENVTSVEESARRAFGVVARRVRQANWWHLYLSNGANKWHPNPITAWLRELGIYGQRSKDKLVPQEIFALSDQQVGLFLRHLWATDGCVWVNPHKRGPKVRIYYATSSQKLAADVQALLQRLGLIARIKEVRKGDFEPTYHVGITGKEMQMRFTEVIGGIGQRLRSLQEATKCLGPVKANTNIDTIPVEVWTRVKESMRLRGVIHREMAALRGSTYGGTSHFRFAPSRTMLSTYAAILGDDDLQGVASSDLFWDEIVSIEPDGSEDVYDMTVVGTHNFVANGIVVHNSIEQDSDLVMFIYRDEVYNPDSDAKGEAELIIAKHRNGPTGMVRLAFMNQYTKFASIAKGL